MNDVHYMIQVLLDSQTNDESSRTSANEQIQQWFSDPRVFIFELSKIIEFSEVPINAIQLSMILIAQMINPSSSDILEKIQFSLEQSPELVQRIKDTINKTIIHENIIIRNQAALIYSRLFIILQLKWIQGIDSIIFILSNPVENANNLMSCLSIFYEILTMKIKFFVYEEINIKIRALFDCCVSFIRTDPQYIDLITLEVRILSAKCINASFPIIIISDVLCATLLGALPNSFQISDIILTQELNQIMLNTICHGYEFAAQFAEMIVDYTTKEFLTDNLCIRNSALILWKEIAEFECFETKCDYFVKTYSPIFLPQAIMTLDNLDFSEILDTSSFTTELADNAIKMMTAFYKKNQSIVLCFIVETCVSIFQERKYASICLLNALICEPCNKQFLSFLEINFGLLLSFTTEENHLSFRVSALITISKAIKYYPVLFGYDVNNIYIKRYASIMSLFTITKSTNESIYIMYSKLISELANSHMDYPKKLFIDNYEHLLKTALAIFDINYSDFNSDILNYATNALNDLVFNVEEKCCEPLLGHFFGIIEEKLRMTIELFESENVRYCFQASLVTIIGTLAIKMANANDICRRSFDILIKLVNRQENLIYEEALFSIASFIPAVGHLIDQSVIKMLVERIERSLSTTSTQTVIAASCLLNNMLKKMPKYFEVIAVDIFKSMSDFILSHSDMRICHPYLLNTLATLFMTIDLDIIYMLKEPLLFLIKKIYSISDYLNFRNRDDVEYANIFYEFLVNCFKAYYIRFAPDTINSRDNILINEEKYNLNTLKELAAYVKKIPENCTSLALIQAYMDLLNDVTKRTCKKNNLLLNKQIIKMPLDIALKHNQTIDDARILLRRMESF